MPKFITDPFRAYDDTESSVEADEPQQTEAPEPEPVKNEEPEVKTGTTKEVLEWVGDDKERARLALEHEEKDSSPRKGLVRELNEILEK